MIPIDTYIKSKNISKALFIFAHPDDESFLSGITIQKLLSLNIEVRVISLTKGGRGKNHLKNVSEELEKIREKEFIKAVKTLGVTNYEIFNFKDASLKESGLDISDLIRKEVTSFLPNMILTFDPSGVTGHPDHISLSKYVNSLLNEYANIKFINFTLGAFEKKFFRKMNSSVTHTLTSEIEVNPSLSMKIRKFKAIESHRSQLRSIKARLLNLLRIFISPKEYLHEVKSEEKYIYEYIDFKI